MHRRALVSPGRLATCMILAIIPVSRCWFSSIIPSSVSQYQRHRPIPQMTRCRDCGSHEIRRVLSAQLTLGREFSQGCRRPLVGRIRHMTRCSQSHVRLMPYFWVGLIHSRGQFQMRRHAIMTAYIPNPSVTDRTNAPATVWEVSFRCRALT